MPSLRDLTDADLGDEISIIEDTPAPADVLARVKADGLRRRNRRHRRNGAIAVLGLALLAVPVATLLPSDDPEDSVTVASEGADEPAPRPSTTEVPAAGSQAPTTATTTPEAATTLPPVVVPTPEPEVELGPAVSIERPLPPPTTQAPPPAPDACRNSTDPACGEFRWDPAPAANQPLSAGFTAPTTAAVGEQVTFQVSWADPDATVTFDNFSPDGVGLGRSCSVEPRYGPWTPPDPVQGAGRLSYTHTFTAPGTYTIVVSLGTADCSSPYGSDTTAEHTITVE